ncbi:MAG: hypothetical protein HY738_05875 [Bacteroidia bacterium]|nr:hypothetical protein [Bacteroidia bacterium]
MRIILISLVLILSQCEETKDENFDCSECYQIKPDWGELAIELTINDENDSVPLIIYRGCPEDNDIEYIDTATSKKHYVEVPLNKYYSVEAYYNVGDSRVIALDGDKIKIKKNTTDCDTTCWYFTGGYINVKLKYNSIP